MMASEAKVYLSLLFLKKPLDCPCLTQVGSSPIVELTVLQVQDSRNGLTVGGWQSS